MFTEKMNKRIVRIGMGQLLVEGAEPERNLQRAEDMVRVASEKGCEIVLLPEVLDLAWTHPSAKTEAQPIPGLYSDRLAKIAKELKVYICAGLTEKSLERVYNTAILINSSGDIILKYRKINLLDVEQSFYSVGQSLSVVDTPFGTIGVNICADNYIDGLPIGHTLARMGVQIILSPSSWTVDYSIDETKDPYGQKWIKPYLILAKLYDLVIIGATSVGYIVGGPYEGKKMIGCSLAVNKDGIIAQGPYLEFAGEIIPVDIEVPERKEKGTDIGSMLKNKGYKFDALI
jgi:hypothetical protein